MNILLAVLTTLCGAGYGLYKSYLLGERAKRLTELSAMLSDMSSEIRYLHAPVLRLCESLGERYGFLEEVSGRVQAGDSFPMAWENAVKAEMALSQSDRQILLGIGATLGASDVESQLAMLSMNQSMLERNLDDASETYRQKGKMYRSVGLLCGVAVGIILL